MSNTQRARICVLVDLLNPLPQQVWVNTSKTAGYFQKVTYEVVPKYCTHCELQGHEKANCLKMNPLESGLVMGKEKSNNTNANIAQQVFDDMPDSRNDENLRTEKATTEVEKQDGRNEDFTAVTKVATSVGTSIPKEMPISNAFGSLVEVEDTEEGEIVVSPKDKIMENNGMNSEEEETMKENEITSPENVQGIPQDAVESSLDIITEIAQDEFISALEIVPETAPDAQVSGNFPGESQGEGLPIHTIVEDNPMSIAPSQIRNDDGIDLCVDFSGYFGCNVQPEMVSDIPNIPGYDQDYPPLSQEQAVRVPDTPEIQNPGCEKTIKEADLIMARWQARQEELKEKEQASDKVAKKIKGKKGHSTS